MKALLPRPPKPEHSEDKGEKGHRHGDRPSSPPQGQQT